MSTRDHQRGGHGSTPDHTWPKFSVITPVYKTPPHHLRDCIESVAKQTWSNWEHILVDDGSQSPVVDEVLATASARDPRVVVARRSANGGIVAASNDALAIACGDWIALLDHDDLLEPNALERMAREIRSRPESVLVYSDWSRVREDGTLVDSFLKPAWSPERLAGNMYLIHFTVMRLDRVRAVGGFRPGYEGSQDHDLALRVTESGGRVGQVRESLYRWRMIPTSTAADPDSKPYARISGVRACQDHFDRIGLQATVRESAHPGLYLIERSPKAGSLVSIIIPTRGTHASVLGRPDAPMVVGAVRSMLADPGVTPFEVIVVYDETADLDYLADLRSLLRDRLTVVPYDKPFNFSEKCNLGAVSSSGDILVFANDDLEVTSPRWLDQLTALVQQPDVGAAGALLFFEDGAIQHAGHTMPPHQQPQTPQPTPSHAYIFQRGDVGYYGDLLLEHEVMGVTAAFVACRRAVFDEIGGFSMKFPGNYNDVDFNFKIRRAGYRIVFSPRVTAWHFESKTRDATVKPDEVRHLHARWNPQLQGDPFHRAGVQ